MTAPVCTCGHIVEDHSDCDAECGRVGAHLICDHIGCPCVTFSEIQPASIQSRIADAIAAMPAPPGFSGWSVAEQDAWRLGRDMAETIAADWEED